MIRLSNVLLSLAFAFAFYWPWCTSLFTSVYIAKGSTLTAATQINPDRKKCNELSTLGQCFTLFAEPCAEARRVFQGKDARTEYTIHRAKKIKDAAKQGLRDHPIQIPWLEATL